MYDSDPEEDNSFRTGARSVHTALSMHSALSGPNNNNNNAQAPIYDSSDEDLSTFQSIKQHSHSSPVRSPEGRATRSHNSPIYETPPEAALRESEQKPKMLPMDEPYASSTQNDGNGQRSWGAWLVGGLGNITSTLLAGVTRMIPERKALPSSLEALPPQNPIAEGTPNNPFAAEEEADEGDSRSAPGLYTIDLTMAIRQYLANEGNATLSLVHAALAQRSFEENVTIQEWNECNGNTRLLLIILESSKVDTGDPKIQESIKTYIDQIIPGEKSQEAILPTGYLPIIGALLRTDSARITRSQEKMMQRSGVQYQQILYDNQHVTKDIPFPGFFSLDMIQFVIQKLRPLWLLIGIGGICFSIVSAVSLAFQEREQKYEREFAITLIFIFSCNGFQFLAIRVLHRRQLRQIATYGVEAADFPTVYLKLFPGVFEVAVFLEAMRHTIVKGGQNVALTHDLYAMFTILFMAHSLFYSTPMLLIQLYLRQSSHYASEAVKFHPVTISNLVCICCTAPVYLVAVVLPNNATFFGFSITAAESDKERASKVSKMLALVLTYFLVYNVFLLVVGVLNIKNCSLESVLYLVAGGVVTTVTVIMFWASVRRNGDVIQAAKWFVLPLILQFGWFVVGEVSTIGRDTTCQVFFEIKIVTVIFNYVGWGLIFFIAFLYIIYRVFLYCHPEEDTTVQESVNPETSGQAQNNEETLNETEEDWDEITSNDFNEEEEEKA